MKKLLLPIAIILLLALAACGDGLDDLPELGGEAATRLAEEAANAAATAAAVATDIADGPDDESPVDEATPEPEPVDEDEPTPEPEPVGEMDRWAGTALDYSMLSLSDVKISVNGAETQSDANGNFEVSVPRADDGRYVINAELDGYLPISQIHIGAAMENLFLEFQPVNTFTFDPQEGVEAADDSGTQISIGANQLEDENGNEPSGDVNLNMYTYDLETEEMVGDMSGTNTNGEEVYMESAGAFYASFEDEDGTEYNLKDGETAEISIPVEEERPDEVLTVWSYDEETGLWVEEGVATLEDGRYVAEVSHFSYWNFDWEKREPACIKLDIEPDYLAANAPLNVKAILQTNPVRVQELSVTDEANVLYNLPTNTDVQFFMPADAATPFATINSGAPWGETGVPDAPYTVCNGVAEIAPAELILQSVNYPDRYLVVNFDGTAVELLPVSAESDDELKQRATFTQVPGLANANMVSLQTNSGAYVVATPDGVTLQASPNTDDLRRAATFNRLDGLADTGISFESLAYPGHYLRHSGFVLRLNTSDDSTLFKEDASYNGVTEFAAVVEDDRPLYEQLETTELQGAILLTGIVVGHEANVDGTVQTVDQTQLEVGHTFQYIDPITYAFDYPIAGVTAGENTKPGLIIGNQTSGEPLIQAVIWIATSSETEVGTAAVQKLINNSIPVTEVRLSNPIIEGDVIEVTLENDSSSELPFIVRFYRGDARELVTEIVIGP